MLPWRKITRHTAPWLIAGGYMLLSGLYARDPQLRFDEALLCFAAIFSCALGHLFVIFLITADAGNDPQGGSVEVSALNATIFGLCSIPYNLWTSRRYTWGPASATGVAIGAISVLFFGALLVWEQAYKQRPRGADIRLQVRRSKTRTDSTAKDPIRQQMARLLISPEPPGEDSSFRLEMPPHRDVNEWLEQGMSTTT